MDENSPKPRLCNITKWPDFQGYGFNLHAERGKAGQYIGKVDDGSPSEAAGLKEGDRIVEVNGTNIGNENHQQVVGRIKAYSDEVNLLVVDAETDKHYKDEKIVVRGDLPEVLQLTSAQPRPSDEPAFHPDEVEVNNAHESDKEEEAVVASFHVQDRSDSDNHSHSSGEVEVQEHTREEEVDTQTREPEPEHEPEVEQNTRDEDEDDDEAIHISSLPPPDTNNIEDNEIEESPPYNPRMCHLRKWPDFSGYGFNLHADKEHGQFIGSIDPDSPAEVGGLKDGDRIIEVDGVNVESLTHQDTIQRIKAGGDETTMLVVDREALAYYRDNNLSIHGNRPEVIFFETPARGGASVVEVSVSNSFENKEVENKENITPVNNVADEESPSYPRECHVIKWPDFQGYGFILHAGKEKTNQYIGQIDANSPAEAAGLKDGDRIVEVNGVNVEKETHQQVIQRVKDGGNETRMLVLDSEGDEYYKARGISVHSSMPEVLHIATPRRDTGMSNGQSPRVSTSEQASPRVSTSEQEIRPMVATADNNQEDLALTGLSAKEMRERLSRKKKVDPRIQKMDFRQKREAFDRM